MLERQVYVAFDESNIECIHVGYEKIQRAHPTNALPYQRMTQKTPLTGQCEVFQKISFLYELKPLQALTYTTCKPGPDENHSQTLKPLSDGHSLKNFALSSPLTIQKRKAI